VIRTGIRRSGAARLALLALTLVLLATCAPPEAPPVVPPPAAAAPEIRIGLAVGAARAEVQGDSGLAMLDQDGATEAVVDPGAAWTIRADGSALAVGTGVGQPITRLPAVSFAPRAPGGLVWLNGRPYRGRVTLSRDRTGLTAINNVSLEDYLAGVVAAEMGRRDSAELEALAAQAIVSRTFAIRNLGKRASDGFDLYATVVDQAYGGVASENPLARAAVARTSGLILTWQGAPIDAFFFSTCGGRTADGTEVFQGADRSYLRSVADTDPSGEPYCRISPRYRWREEWTAGQLRAVVRQSLPPVSGTPPEQAETVNGVRVTGLTGSGRVSRLSLQLAAGPVEVSGPAVRSVLHPVGETLLRSATFRLLETRDGAELTRLVAEGSGAGHGVGFCQWGAVGRARAGQDAFAILAAYFPGTVVSRAY
jgi:stage II sporulation protein D